MNFSNLALASLVQVVSDKSLANSLSIAVDDDMDRVQQERVHIRSNRCCASFKFAGYGMFKITWI